MSSVGQREIKTQQRAIRFCKDEPDYRHLGNWKDRTDNSNVEDDLLADCNPGRVNGDAGRKIS